MFVGGLLVVACWAPPPARKLQELELFDSAKRPEPVQPPVQPEEEGWYWRFDAVVRAAEPTDKGGKQFRGVKLVEPDGQTWVVTYQPEGWLRVFDGRTVRVTGRVYEPPGQALIRVRHYRIATITVKDRQRGVGPLFGVGPERTLVGRFRQAQGAAGSKSEGETYSTFLAADGTSYLLEGWPEGELEHGPVVEVIAREVEPDLSYRARRDGNYLWIIAIEKL